MHYITPIALYTKLDTQYGHSQSLSSDYYVKDSTDQYMAV